jgi:ATP-dependent Clp protease ATP-binding subunit ClpA
MDEAASALRLQQESKPEDIMQLDQKIMTIQIELESLRKETDISSKERREKLESSLKECQEEAAKLTEKWNKEKAEIDVMKRTKEDLEKARVELEQAQVSVHMPVYELNADEKSEKIILHVLGNCATLSFQLWRTCSRRTESLELKLLPKEL